MSVGGWVLPCIRCPSTVKCVHSKDGRLVLIAIAWNRAWPPGERSASSQPAPSAAEPLQYAKGTGGGTNLPAVTPGGSAGSGWLCGRFLLLLLNLHLQFLRNTSSQEVLGRRAGTEENVHYAECRQAKIMQRKTVSADGVGNTFHCLLRHLQRWKLKWPFQGLYHRHLRYWGWFWETTGLWGTSCCDWLEGLQFFAHQGWYKNLCRSPYEVLAQAMCKEFG